MHLLLLVTSCFIICMNVEAQVLSAQSDGLQAETANAGDSQPDAYVRVPNELPAPKKDNVRPLGQDNSEQQLLLTQKNMAAYPRLYNANRQRPLPYEYPTYGSRQKLYGMSQPESIYRNYQTPNYMSYPYGNGETMQQQSWNSPTQKPEQDFFDYPRPSNQPQGGYWPSLLRPQDNGQSWYSIPRPNVYGQLANRQMRRQPYPHWMENGRYSIQPQSPPAKPKEFEASEERFLAEYSTGSLQDSDLGIQLIEDESTKDQNTNQISSGMGWQNYPITRPAWPLPKPVAPTPFQPISSADSWRRRPSYIQRNNWQRYPNTNVESPEQININKNMCYNKCRRRCGMRQGACGGSRPNYRSNTNGMARGYSNNGQYWGAASNWNTVLEGNKNSKPQEIVNKNDIPKEKICGPENGQWKWIGNDWKWVCIDETPKEGSEDGAVIDA